jgi:putative membrane protein
MPDKFHKSVYARQKKMEQSNSSLNRSIDDAKKHYSSMFSLPSFKTALVGVGVLCVVNGLLAFVVAPSQGLISAIFLGLSFFVLTIMADLLMNKVLLNGDPVFSLRRILVLSLASFGFWLIFIVFGVGLTFLFGWLIWVKLSMLGYAVVITLRIIVLTATSMASGWRKGLSVLLQPTLCMVAFLFFWAGLSSAITLQILVFIVVSPIISFVAVTLFFRSIEGVSKKLSPMASIPLFRAFIVDWVSNVNAPLEKYLEDMGHNTDIEVNMLKFNSSKPKAAIIVPLVHPGPFKNIGSSVLPSLLKQKFEEEYRCATCTPLGILGHELDLASQAQNQKIISQVIDSANFEASSRLASRFVRASEGPASASCQIFGDTALLTFTLAPKTTEDLPQELGRIVQEQAASYGLKNAIVINAHNSLTDIDDTHEYLDELQVAASKCLQKAVNESPEPFMVGGASVFPHEFSLKQGMGAGGITAIVVKVEDQKTAYIVIDGNNMVPNLREIIINALSSIGFGESEVFTTDTHSVTGMVTGKQGYNSVGKAIDHERLIKYILEAARTAESKLENCKSGSLRLVVPQVRVIGEESLKSITTLVDKAIQKAKQTLLPVFGLEGLILLLLLLLL